MTDIYCLLTLNRGEIATRVISTARELSIETYTLYTTNDSTHTLHSKKAIEIPSSASYLDIDYLITLVKQYEIDAIHPGYGFLSESADFASRMWEEAACVVIGPGPSILSRTGDKLQARSLASECSVPVLPALQTPTSSIADLAAFAAEVGYPIIVKAVDGGGGRGIRIVHGKEKMEELAKKALQESPSGTAFAEKAALGDYRHVEVQILGDGQGNVRHLWERECSIQRRFQKVVEFAPASVPDRRLIGQVIKAAIRMAQAVDYYSLGTFEFLVRSSPPSFYFLEVNPRLQVEHTVTEALSGGLDLVRIQLLLAQGHPLSSLTPSHLLQDPETPPPMRSLQLRITAEDVASNWSLSVGKINAVRFPAGHGIRVDTHLLPGNPTIIGTEFDSLLAKIIVTAPTWEEVVQKSRRALEDTYISGITTNLSILQGIVLSEAFSRQKCDTQWLEKNTIFLLKLGQAVATSSISEVPGSEASSSSPTTSSANLLFRKGDAWSLSLTPASSNTEHPLMSEPGHIQITRIKQNDFPRSLALSLLHTSSSSVRTPYTVQLNSTTASGDAVTSTSRHRRGDVKNQRHITLPFAGRLIEMCVEVGQEVQREQVVAVVRQMKMELDVRASKSGTVKWVYEGEVDDEVGEGVLIAELEEGVKL
ncbi:pyruvate carboxylase [Phlyctema vagabunda]|uniref:Pyruvate carboxylase n=1 Tax=Phlyctema vagabunda TaxID=108571 RepID=A0ABR4PHU0_9HELO